MKVLTATYYGGDSGSSLLMYFRKPTPRYGLNDDDNKSLEPASPAGQAREEMNALSVSEIILDINTESLSEEKNRKIEDRNQLLRAKLRISLVRSHP
ncbi:MAG: hypothetical protein ABR574_06010 [Cryomorphaceae bacterium]|nr:hypothetical protein [Flavobacteriales bacterium]